MGEDEKDAISQADAFSAELENAKQRLADQRDTIREFSQEGMRMFRLILLFVAVPTTIMGAFQRPTLSRLWNGISGSQPIFTNPDFPIWGITIIVASSTLISAITHLAAAGFEARGVRNLTNPADIEKTLNELEPRDYQKFKLEKLKNRIEQNDRVIFVLEGILAIGKFTLSIAILCAALLTYPTSTGNSIPAVYLLFLLTPVLIFLFITLVQLPEEYRSVEKSLLGGFRAVYREEQSVREEDGDNVKDS